MDSNFFKIEILFRKAFKKEILVLTHLEKIVNFLLLNFVKKLKVQFKRFKLNRFYL